MTDKNSPDKSAEANKTAEQKGEALQGPSASITLTAKTAEPKKTAQKKAEPKKNTTNKSASSVESKPSVSEKKPLTGSTSTSSVSAAKESPTTMPKTSESATTQPWSKTALLALLIALIACAGVGGLFYWHQQQQQTFQQQLLTEDQQANQQRQQALQQLLSAQQSEFAQQWAQNEEKLLATSQARINQLEQAIARLSQNEPTDWLLHEAEYLVRIAGRSLWLEHDTSAAINLLQDADARLAELNNPALLPVRKLVHQDIEQLKLMPVLDHEAIIMQVMALAKQVPNLTLAMVDIPDSEQQRENLQLSESASDWQVNLKKTWQKFLDDFITVRRRAGDVEPLLSPQHQQNLFENLKLKLQTVQWAISDEKSALYLASLTDVNEWLQQYYDMDNVANQRFASAIEALKAEQISFDYPSHLSSLKALRQIMKQEQPSPVQPPAIEPSSSETAAAIEGRL